MNCWRGLLLVVVLVCINSPFGQSESSESSEGLQSPPCNTQDCSLESYLHLENSDEKGENSDEQPPPAAEQYRETSNEWEGADSSSTEDEEAYINDEPQDYGENGGEENEEYTEEVLNCVFKAIPIIGGEWITRLARLGYTDRALIEGIHSFLAGGKVMARYIDPRGISSATRLVRSLGWCLEGGSMEPPKRPFQTFQTHGNTVQTKDQRLKFEAGHHNNKIMASSDSQHREKRNVKGSSSVAGSRKKRNIDRTGAGGYGHDSLVGFNLLGVLVVGALITYLVYLLTV